MNLNKPIIAQMCGVGFTAFVLKGLLLILFYKEVLIMEPNRFILYLEIASIMVLLVLSIQGLIQSMRAQTPEEDEG